MIYQINIGDDYWTTSESPTPIKKTEGFYILEEVLSHPNKNISITRTFLAHNFPAAYSVPFCEVTQGIGSDYLKSCYNSAQEERSNGLFLYKQYMLYKEKVELSRKSLSQVEVDFYTEQLDKMKQIIVKTLNVQGNVENFIRDVNHKACCDVIKARNKLKKKSPFLFEYIMNTFTFGRIMLYDPKKSEGIILIIRENIVH